MKKTNNLTIKLIALFFAIILWSYVMDQENPEITKEIQNIKVELSNVEYLQRSNLVLEDNNTYVINVKIKGRRNEIINVTDKDIIAEADIAGYQEGEHKVPIKVTIPSKNESLEDFYPKTILLKLDKVIERQVPVKFQVEGNVKSGYILGESELKQTNILIRGPRNLVNLVSEAKATLKLSQEDRNINATLPVRLVDVNGKEIVNNITKEPNVVDISVPVYKTKTVNLVANVVGIPVTGYQTTSTKLIPSNIKIKGYEQDLINIDSLKTEEINIDNLSSSLNTNALIVLPSGVSIIGNISNVDVVVNIEKITEETFEYLIDEISIYNIDSGLELDKSSFNSKISITIQGIESKVKQLKKEDIRPYITVEGLTEGTHQVEIKMYKPYGIDLVKVNPSKFEVKLKTYVKEQSSESIKE